MAAVTRTTNPIHFEDLEPHRFEDLVRQLAYEFKPWRKLEATGRGGADAGFDARGYEIVGGPDLAEPDDESEEGSRVESENDRLWLIQCKRERLVGPTKISTYIADIPKEERARLYGVVFAAASDFTKKTRDRFDAKCREMRFKEWHLWGKAELEDMLFQPQNDHLLFAYFGFSLAIRKRSLRSEIRARLA